MIRQQATVAALLGLAATVGCAAGSNAPALQPQIETPASTESTEGTPVPDEDVEVQVDLSSSGMAALISAPKSAAVRAAADEVEIVGGSQYHLLVGRGTVDPLGEKSRIVRAFGDEFRRYLRDDGDLLVYETGNDQVQRYHFFMVGKAGSLDFHCRTPADGMESRDSVEHMVEVCQHVELAKNAEVPKQSSQ